MAAWSEVPRDPRGPLQHFFPRARETRRRLVPRPQDKLAGGVAPIDNGVEKKVAGRRHCSGRASELTSGLLLSGDPRLGFRRCSTQSAPALRSSVLISDDAGFTTSSTPPSTTRRHFCQADHIKGADLQVVGDEKQPGQRRHCGPVAVASLSGPVVSLTSTRSSPSRRNLAPQSNIHDGATVTSGTRSPSKRIWPRSGTRVGALMRWDYGPGWKPSGEEGCDVKHTTLPSQQSPMTPERCNAPQTTQAVGIEETLKRPQSAPCLASPHEGPAQLASQDSNTGFQISRANPSNDGAENERRLHIDTAHLHSDGGESGERLPAARAQAESDAGEKHATFDVTLETTACDSMEAADPLFSSPQQEHEFPLTPPAQQCARQGASPISACHSSGDPSRQDFLRPAAGLAIRRHDHAFSPFSTSAKAYTPEVERATIIRNALAEAVGLPIKPFKDSPGGA